MPLSPTEHKIQTNNGSIWTTKQDKKISYYYQPTNQEIINLRPTQIPEVGFCENLDFDEVIKILSNSPELQDIIFGTATMNLQEEKDYLCLEIKKYLAHSEEAKQGLENISKWILGKTNPPIEDIEAFCKDAAGHYDAYPQMMMLRLGGILEDKEIEDKESRERSYALV